MRAETKPQRANDEGGRHKDKETETEIGGGRARSRGRQRQTTKDRHTKTYVRGNQREEATDTEPKREASSYSEIRRPIGQKAWQVVYRFNPID